MAEPKLTVDDFIQLPEIIACLGDLRSHFQDHDRFIISDVIDNDGHQFVHLVQKGGGVLGVALVGYTYVLEQMGVRFLKQAGTSAGAINTALLSVLGQKQDPKSEKVLQAICDLDMFTLVDGHPFAKWVIRKFLTRPNFSAKMKRLATYFISSLFFFLLVDLVLTGLQHSFDSLGFITSLFFLLTGLLALSAISIIFYFGTLIKRLKNAGFGINPGDIFYDWIKEQFRINEVYKVSDLNAKVAAKVPGLKLRDSRDDDLSDLDGSVKFITSELCSENKIIFPEMCDLFRRPEDIDNLQPAGFVRASMSIPVFFESYLIKDIPCKDPAIRDVWISRFKEKDPPSIARFVDGGLLSNFPMSVFYNPRIHVPRLPVFGIDLDTSTGGDKGKSAENWTLPGYLSRMFNTIQINSDKEFLLKNKVYEMGVGKINCAGFNWLNFFMKNNDKKALFVIGARAAALFLKNFDWQEYKRRRAEMQSVLERPSNL